MPALLTCSGVCTAVDCYCTHWKVVSLSLPGPDCCFPLACHHRFQVQSSLLQSMNQLFLCTWGQQGANRQSNHTVNTQTDRNWVNTQPNLDWANTQTNLNCVNTQTNFNLKACGAV